MKRELFRFFLILVVFISGTLGLNGFTSFLPIFIVSAVLFIEIQFRVFEILRFLYLFHTWPFRGENSRKFVKLRLEKQIRDLREKMGFLYTRHDFDYPIRDADWSYIKLSNMVQRREKTAKKFGFLSKGED